jgi:general secretion pathway protein D
MNKASLGIRFSFLLLALIYGSLAGPSLLSSQEGGNPESGEAMITMDFQDVDLTVLIKFISELTGKNFILDEKAKGKKVTVISPTKITKEEAYKVFESILEIKDLATVPSGRVIKIVPAKDAMEKSLRTVVGQERAPDSDTLITRLVSLDYVDPNEMVKILKPLMSRDSKLDAYGPTNTLIMTEAASNIARLLRIIKQLDIRADQMEMDVLPLEYASAEVMARQLQEILQTLVTSTAAGGPTGAGMARRALRQASAPAAGVAGQGFTGKIISDDRTNSLIVLASETQLDQIRELVHKLDYDTPRAYGNINVYYLEYANAEDIATVLTDLVSGASSLGRNGAGAKAGSPPVQGPARTLASFEGEVSITADPATNALIIVATPRDYLTLKNVISRLDIRRKQVYVEAVIMEIQPQFLHDFGVEYRGAIPLEGGDNVDKVLLGGTNFGQGANDLISSATALSSGELPTGATNADSGLFPLDLGNTAGLTLGGIFDRVKVGEDANGNPIYLPANVLVLHALEQTSKANLLSTPHLIAMDNEEAEIIVGRNVPFVTSTSQTTVSTVQQVQRESVGITLRFTPQITEGDYIQLELYQEISALIESPVGQDPNRVGPTTSERKSTNTVLVRDGQTIIVGGLMEDRIRTSESKVPWLGDIPGLGWLFRYQNDTVEKQNLLIFLTPTIIREDQDVQRLYEEKKAKMLEYKDRHDLPVEYMDVRPFEKRSPLPGAEHAEPQLGEPEAKAPEDVPEGEVPVEELPTPPPAPPGEAGLEQGAAEPTYEITIKGADRLDSPALPDLPDEQ